MKIDPDGRAAAAFGVSLTKGSKVKGSFTCWITNEMGGETGTAVYLPNQLPAVIRIENGTRNFAEAASHNTYRAWGPYLLNTSARRPIAAANSVDCHRWFAMG
jgi:hypothetical protein